MVKPKRNAGSAPRATDFVESLDRGLRLLQVFGDRAAPMTLSEIAAAADLPRATARRILFTLQHGGYVTSDGKLFALTPHVLTLAGSYLRSNQLPSYETNCIEDWETKLDKIVQQTIHQNMTLISGIPPWLQMYFDWLVERSEGKKIKELFPNPQNNNVTYQIIFGSRSFPSSIT